MKKMTLAASVIIIGFLVFVSSRDGQFRYERSGIINAPAEKIFPYLSNFRRGREWSPYEKIDPNMKKTFTGSDGQIGSTMEFDGNNKAGAGRLELLRVVPNELVVYNLKMTRPFEGENIVLYRLTPEGNGTRFSWAMSVNSGYIGKLVSVFIDCEKLVGDQFVEGINNLKTLVESQK